MQRIEPAHLFMRRIRLVFLLIIFLAAIPGVHHVYEKERESNMLTSKTKKELSDLEIRAQKLATDVRALDTNRGREAALRQQYAMGKDGEGLIVIVNATNSLPIENASSTEMKSWVKRFFPWWH